MTLCIVCNVYLRGKQKRFCSPSCKSKGQSNSVYKHQKDRGLQRKNRLLIQAGGKCIRCGYSKCMRALTFHHRDPSTKSFPLDARSCAGRPQEILNIEAAKCDLLCFNCHMEIEEELYGNS